MLPGPLLKAEPLVVIIKDGGSVVGFAKGAWRGEEVGAVWHRVVRLEIQVWLCQPFGDNVFICSTFEGFKKFILCTYTLSELFPFYRHALQLYVFGTPRAQFSPFAAH